MCRLEPLSAAAHGDGLYEASSVADAGGRFTLAVRDAAREPRGLPALARASVEASEDPLFFAVIDKASGKMAGRQTLMRIEPAYGVIEIGNIYWGPLIARKPRRDRGAVPVHAIRLRRRSATGATSGNATTATRPSKRAAHALRLHLRGHFSPAHGRQGREPRHGVVSPIIDREWPALKQAYRGVARPVQLRRRRTPEAAARRFQGRRQVAWLIPTTMDTTTIMITTMHMARNMVRDKRMAMAGLAIRTIMPRAPTRRAS